MFTSMWFMSIVALLVVDVRTGALQERDIHPSRCHECGRGNGTLCEAGSWPAVLCPPERPLCATMATSPHFMSSLSCAAATKTPCSLNQSNNSLELTCVCTSHLCNAPFSSQLRNELLNFTYTLTNNNSVNIAQIFFTSSKFSNISEESLYKAITMELSQTTTEPEKNSQISTVVPVSITVDTHAIMRDSEKPRAEGLKQEPTVPSDDDEDETEGSGAYEESRVHNHAVSAPAAPSSFLPANENSATTLYKDLIISILFVYIVF